MPLGGNTLCAVQVGGRSCPNAAQWLIVIGESEHTVACDEHRNDALMKYDTKDVSGIFPLEASGPGQSVYDED